MKRLLLVVFLAACGTRREGSDAGGVPPGNAAGCEAFCAKSKQCDPEAIDPAQCTQSCPQTISEPCRRCVAEQGCEAIRAGACDSACG